MAISWLPLLLLLVQSLSWTNSKFWCGYKVMAIYTFLSTFAANLPNLCENHINCAHN